MDGNDVHSPATRLAQCERELELMRQVLRACAATEGDPEEILQEITQTVGWGIGADAGMLVLASDDELPSVAFTFDPNALIVAQDDDALQRVHVAAAALHTTSYLEPGELLARSGIDHLLAAPLMTCERRLGHLIYFARGRRFDSGDLTALRTASLPVAVFVSQLRARQRLESLGAQDRELRRQLEAIYRVDRIRDMSADLDLFPVQVADVLVDILHADLCVVVVQEEGEPKVKAVRGQTGDLDLAQVTARLPTLTAYVSATVHRSLDAALREWGFSHVLVAPLSVGRERLGTIVLGNKERPFSQADESLVQAVVSQADSALVYARTLQRARERAAQLETVYRIDRIRDETDDAQEILSAVANIVTQALDADLCLVSLIGEESGRNELKAVKDRQGVFGRIERAAIQSAIRWAATLHKATMADESPLARWGLRHMIGAPLIVASERLGALVLARELRPFGRAERELLQAAVSQTDSAIVHARAVRQLRQRNKELETLYRVDYIRDQGYDFGTMLNAVLNELCTAIDAEMGFIMLFDRDSQQLELRASTADDILATASHYDVIEAAADEALRSGHLYVADDLGEQLRSIMCVPLILRNRIIGVFGAVNRRGAGGFTTDDQRLLLAITSQVDTAIFESLDKQRIRETFQRYVGPRVVEQMLDMPEKDFLKGERALLTVLFSDMRGFTSVSERVDVDVLVEMLNMHLGAMTEVVIANGGTLDKFVADEVVAIFGAPLPMPDHALRAIRTALEMQAAQRELMAEWRRRGYTLPPIGIGINTGEVVVGNIGCEKQMDYTVIGDVVNVASRLCDKALGEQVLVTEDTYDMVADRVEAIRLPQVRVKGKKRPIQVYQVVGLRE